MRRGFRVKTEVLTLHGDQAESVAGAPRLVYMFILHHVSLSHSLLRICDLTIKLHGSISVMGSLVAQAVKNLPAMQETQDQSLGRDDTLENEMATTPVFLPAEFHGHRGLAGYIPWGHKSWT